MKSAARLDAEINRVETFVNSFNGYDRNDLTQRSAFDILHALRWVRGRKETDPMKYLSERPVGIRSTAPRPD